MELLAHVCLVCLQPFFAQAEREKLSYEAARRLYEEGGVGIGSAMSFDQSPGASGSGADPNETTSVLTRPTVTGSGGLLDETS